MKKILVYSSEPQNGNIQKTFKYEKTKFEKRAWSKPKLFSKVSNRFTQGYLTDPYISEFTESKWGTFKIIELIGVPGIALVKTLHGSYRLKTNETNNATSAKQGFKQTFDPWKNNK